MTVTLNRPDKLNAFNTVMSRELIDFFGRVNAMDEVRAIVVTGAGRAFCAGADISGGSGAFQVWNDGNKPQKREASDLDHAGDLQLPEADRGGDQRRGGRRRHHHVPADGRAHDVERRPASASCSTSAAWRWRPARAGSCRGWSACSGRRNG